MGVSQPLQDFCFQHLEFPCFLVFLGDRLLFLCYLIFFAQLLTELLAFHGNLLTHAASLLEYLNLQPFVNGLTQIDFVKFVNFLAYQ
jgi:hypothetical protein